MRLETQIEANVYRTQDTTSPPGRVDERPASSVEADASIELIREFEESFEGGETLLWV